MEPTIDLDTEFGLAVAKLEQAKVTLKDAKEAASKVLRKRREKHQPGEQGEVIRIKNNATVALNMAQKRVDELQDLLMRHASTNSIESSPASGIESNGAIGGLNPDTPQTDSREFNVSQPPQGDNGVETHDTTSHQTPAMLDVECNVNLSQTQATILGFSDTAGERDLTNEVATLEPLNQPPGILNVERTVNSSQNPATTPSPSKNAGEGDSRSEVATPEPPNQTLAVLECNANLSQNPAIIACHSDSAGEGELRNEVATLETSGVMVQCEDEDMGIDKEKHAPASTEFHGTAASDADIRAQLLRIHKNLVRAIGSRPREIRNHETRIKEHYSIKSLSSTMCTAAIKDVMSLNEEDEGSAFEAERLAGEITSAKQEMKTAQEEIDKLRAANEGDLRAQEIDKGLLLDINKLEVLWKSKDELSIRHKQERLSSDARVSLLMEWQEVNADIETMKACLEVSRKRWGVVKDTGKVADEGKANTTGLRRGVDMQSKWEDASEEERADILSKTKSALDSFIKKGTTIPPHTRVLIRTVQEVLPEAAMTSRELARHIFLTNSKETYICHYHKIRQHSKEKHDGAHVEGVAYTKEYEDQPPAGIWSCGCDEEACLFEFFVWKTWKVASMNKKLNLVEAMSSEEYWSCRVRAFIWQNFKSFTCITLDNIYTHEGLVGSGEYERVLRYRQFINLKSRLAVCFTQEEFTSIFESGTTQIHKMDGDSDDEEIARRKKPKTEDSAGGKGNHVSDSSMDIDM